MSRECPEALVDGVPTDRFRREIGFLRGHRDEQWLTVIVC